MYTRLISPLNSSFFLFGPRGTGKSTWVKQTFKDAFIVDLLTNRESLRYSKDPSLLTAQVLIKNRNQWIVIDEVQKVPKLLDEVHHLMENEGYKKFVLSGSSARKLKRGAANLLAGRAIIRKMFPLTSSEVDFDFSTEDILKHGFLPLSFTAKENQQKEEILKTYVSTYLSEEVKAESLVRSIGDFSRFLDVAAISAGTAPNISGLSRDAGIGRDTVQNYFTIFEDTLLGTWLPAYRPRLKVKEVAKPKFYWFDCGVLNAAIGAFEQPMPQDWNGILLEHFIHSELKAFIEYNNIKGSLGYWSTPGKTEVDFVHWYGDKITAIEVKYSKNFKKEFLKGIKSVQTSKKINNAFLIYNGNEDLKIDDVYIFTVKNFLKRLHSGDILS